MRWYALDTTAKENWTSGTTGRYTSPLDPAFTLAEQLYWEQSGSSATNAEGVAVSGPTGLLNGSVPVTLYYNPLSRCNIIGGSGVGARPDIGLVTEWFSQAFLGETAAEWSAARLFATCYGSYPYSWMLDDTVHRLIPLNNGPLDVSGVGGGGNYPGLAATQPNTYKLAVATSFGVGPSLQFTPDATYNGYGGGLWGPGSGYLNDHMPSFVYGAYQIFGSRHLLDDLYQQGNRAMQSTPTGPGENYRDFVMPTNGLHYRNDQPPSFESRAGYWKHRDTVIAAAFGGDANPEKAYFTDLLHENFNYWTQFKIWKDGGGSSFTNSFNIYEHGAAPTIFMQAMGAAAAYTGWTLLRDPLSQDGISRARRQIEC